MKFIKHKSNMHIMAASLFTSRYVELMFIKQLPANVPAWLDD